MPELEEPVTLKQKAISLLTERGMFDRDAEEVFEMVKADPSNAAMANRWNDEVERYPKQMLPILLFSVKRSVVAWIEQNCPQAWYKPLFTDEA